MAKSQGARVQTSTAAKGDLSWSGLLYVLKSWGFVLNITKTSSRCIFVQKERIFHLQTGETPTAQFSEQDIPVSPYLSGDVTNGRA